MKWLLSGSYFGTACTTAFRVTSRMAHSCSRSWTQAVMPSVVLALVAWKSFCFYPLLWERNLKVSMEHVVFWDNGVKMMGLKKGIGMILASSFVHFTLLIVPTLQVWFSLFVSECMSQIQPNVVLEATKNQCAPAAEKISVLRTRLELSWSKTPWATWYNCCPQHKWLCDGCSLQQDNLVLLVHHITCGCRCSLDQCVSVRSKNTHTQSHCLCDSLSPRTSMLPWVFRSLGIPLWWINCSRKMCLKFPSCRILSKFSCDNCTEEN